MATDTQWVTTVLDEAAAIVEAEWMRLEHDEDLWEREAAGLLAELPATRPCRPRIGVATVQRRWSGDWQPQEPRPGGPRRWPAHQVWATQRSPPGHEGYRRKSLSHSGGDARGTPTNSQRLASRPPAV